MPVQAKVRVIERVCYLRGREAHGGLAFPSGLHGSKILEDGVIWASSVRCVIVVLEFQIVHETVWLHDGMRMMVQLPRASGRRYNVQLFALQESMKLFEDECPLFRCG